MRLICLLLLSIGLWAAEPVQLFPIEGPWKMHFGDDLRWATPDFDDSAWDTCQPPAQGKGFAWYRHTVKVPTEIAQPASFWFPDLADESEIYANGKLVLQYGEPGKWYTFRRGPVPPIELTGREVTLAIRIRSKTAFSVTQWRTPQMGSRTGSLFGAGGSVVIANAGHPSPYCDGVEVEVEAGLPLGLIPDAVYSESSHGGDRFTFVSDGVVEADNGELFGFERTREISGRTAHEISGAAKSWGQNDDITVVTVRREA